MSNKYKKVLGGLVKNANWFTEVYGGLTSKDDRGISLNPLSTKNPHSLPSIIKHNMADTAKTTTEAAAEGATKPVKQTADHIEKTIKRVQDNAESQMPRISRKTSEGFIEGLWNNPHTYRLGGGVLGGLLLSAFMKNKSLAWLLGLVGGGFAGDYLHKNWKGDWSKTWDGVKSKWGSK
jgi:hypothetical protein